MNLQCVYVILSLLIFVKLNFSRAQRVNIKKGGPLTDIRNRFHSPQLYNYYNILHNPLLKRHILKLIKKKKYRDNLRPFADLTRHDDYLEYRSNLGNANKFSEDYIDISDLAKYEVNLADKINKDITYKIKPKPVRKALNDISDNNYQLYKMLDQVARRMVPYQKRSNVYQSESEDSSGSWDSDIQKTNSRNHGQNKGRSRFIPKRFEVINNNSGEAKTDDDVINLSIDISSAADDDNDETVSKNYNSETKSDDEGTSNEYIVYVQSPTRHLKTQDAQWRRRLKHFLPKRVHWDEKDFQDLTSYWINGPRGRYPDKYKTPY